MSILKNCEACQRTKLSQSFGPCRDCSCDCHKPKSPTPDKVIDAPVEHPMRGLPRTRAMKNELNLYKPNGEFVYMVRIHPDDISHAEPFCDAINSEIKSIATERQRLVEQIEKQEKTQREDARAYANTLDLLAADMKSFREQLAAVKVKCAICTTPLPFPDTIPGCCYKCALTEAETLLGNALRESERLTAALGLKECVECGMCGFEISPFNPSEGFCWNCHKLLTVAQNALQAIEGEGG